jgi:hypothetical protein
MELSIWNKISCRNYCGHSGGDDAFWMAECAPAAAKIY